MYSFVWNCLFCTFSWCHCIVCPSSTNGFRLPLWYIQIVRTYWPIETNFRPTHSFKFELVADSVLHRGNPEECKRLVEKDRSNIETCRHRKWQPFFFRNTMHIDYFFSNHGTILACFYSHNPLKQQSVGRRMSVKSSTELMLYVCKNSDFK